MSEEKTHKAGFVSIVGKPNVGKSTLMNQLVGERLSIITSKAQTTRHRIMGIMSTEDYQIVYSDTPGIITPKYELHESMMDFVDNSLSDSDVILFVTDIFEQFKEKDALIKLEKAKAPIIVIINKIDMAKQDEVLKKVEYWKEKLNPKVIMPVSALHGFNVQAILDEILDLLPEHAAFYDKEELTDKPMRFFVSEIIREKIFLHYKDEVPYSCEVMVDSYKETPDLVKIRATIMVERDSQKGIIIGKGGIKLKHVGADSRKELEKFIQKKVFLETHVKVDADWRKNDKSLKMFGYKND
ncbi:GTPase Era [Flammeovirga yaeyamensis]|uniref:GTPase Era n=1 Tax=Flammeovirga yaeyamensis TaxID=367791 RepID=A0AAX1N3D9_9BACT|nr:MULTISPECIES: GTPase Era [Flammeovirga]ANQ50598.1 GTPase Era [Flammeovirga sp. MY04]MBB3700570.1 GTP-binding protein Era [Flammeovirga yaeyamensis]NMF37687.1 GTPase Era [Flammeovirga yaeyamensis]QWG01996.1 GTPase Era [Flammeovirga yaeyamensis]